MFNLTMQTLMLVTLLVALLASVSHAAIDVAGVTLGSEVYDRAVLDLDLFDILTNLTASKDAAAKTIYENGLYSQKPPPTGGLRSFKSLSRGDLKGNLYKVFQKSYNDSMYANTFIINAFDSLAEFAGKTPEFRREAIVNGIRALTLWMYVIHELEDGVQDCIDGTVTNNMGAVNAAEEAWAFYVGSLEGRTTGGSDTAGVALFQLATDMCAQFATCTPLPGGRQAAIVNNQLALLMSDAAINSRQEFRPCLQTRSNVNDALKKLKVPLIQALIYNVYSASQTSLDATTRTRAWGAAWAFQAALKPMVQSCAPSVSTLIAARLNPQNAATPDAAAAAEVVRALESTYTCLEVTCADIGAFTAGGHQKCRDNQLAGYRFRTSVMDRAFIDLDVRDILTLLGSNSPSKYQDAMDIYTKGLHSVKSSGSMRTLAALSTDFGKFSAEPIWNMFKSFFGSDKYADDFIKRAMQGQGEFVGKPDAVKRECSVKGIQYLTVWNYVIHELEDGIATCNSGLLNDRSDDADGVHNVDEAWAFYTGSAHWSPSTTAGQQTGYLMYQANIKRCAEVKTCTPDGRSPINDRVLALMSGAQSAAEIGDCKTFTSNKNSIVTLMTIPLIQGMMKYMFLADINAPVAVGTRSADLMKEWAEGYAFYYSVIPFINQVDTTVAATLRKNLDMRVATTPMVDGYLAVTRALVSVFPKLGVSCKDISFFHATQQCTDPVTTVLANYRFVSDVMDRARIDLDIREINSLVGRNEWTKAYQLYLLGNNSVKYVTNEVRSLAKLSTQYQKFEKEPTWKLFRNYYNNSNTYAHDLISSALLGTGVFRNKAAIFRQEISVKAIQYMTMFNYVQHELAEGIDECINAVEDANVNNQPGADKDRVSEADEAWAFFVGSLHLDNPEASGYLHYNLNMRRCTQFKTCVATGSLRSRTNDRTLALFSSAQAALEVKDCNTYRDVVMKIRNQMTIGLIQGLLRYTYYADLKSPAQQAAAKLDEFWAEGYAFAAALLPLINACSPSAAAVISSNFDLNRASPVPDGYMAVTKALQSVYSCPEIGVTCTEVGYIHDSMKCQDPSLSSAPPASTSTLSGGAIAGIVIGCLVFYLISLVITYKRGKQSGVAAASENAGISSKQRASAANGNGNGHHNGNGNGKQEIEVV